MFLPSGMTAALLAAVHSDPGHTAYYYAKKLAPNVIGGAPWVYRAARTLTQHGYLVACRFDTWTDYYVSEKGHDLCASQSRS